MPLPVLMPVGIIETHESENTLTFLRLPVDHNKLKVDEEIVIWNYYNDNLARCRGTITELTESVASVQITNSKIDTNWPEDKDPFGYANPVYIAATDVDDIYQPLHTTEMMVPDNDRMKLLVELSNEHLNTANIPPAHAVATTTPQMDIREIDCNQ